MNAHTRASVTRMHANTTPPAGFKRQVVFRVGPDDWQLLQTAATEHGSLQAALIAGLRALTKPKDPLDERPTRKPKRARTRTPARRDPPQTHPTIENPDEEISARDAAEILGLKTSTVSGYICSGRLPGRYDDSPTQHGWVITRRAVAEYLATRGPR